MPDYDSSNRTKVVGPTGASADQTQGTAAHGAAAVGSPVQVAGKYDTAYGTLDTGDVGTLRLNASGSLIVETAGTGVSGSATFTPAASSHTAGDCNGAAQDFALAAPSGCRLMITDATLSIASGTAQATAWRLYLYNVTPPSAIADDGVFDFTVATDGAAFLGHIDLGTAIDLGGGQWVENRAINKAVKLTGTTVFGYLVNLTTLTTAAVAHRVTLIGVPL
jgi:hypothetical protein